MKTLKEATAVTKSNVGETKRATIKASAKIFSFFSEQIYSDKYTAIWRELVANAIDAQKMNGETRPPVVTAPSMLEPYAKVRDFGCSMDHEFMMDKFMAFTDASTKEHSDDFIGGFGIGSKAPLAYTEQYSIKCYLDGVVRVYSIFKDEEGCPSIAFLSEDETSEPDGVEVGFPVRQDDIQRFTSTLTKTLRYFNPLPILEGTEIELNPVEYDVRGDKWGLRSHEPNVTNRNGRIIIGGVAYPLNAAEIGYEYTNLRQFSNYGLDLFLDIGEANIALSREHVTHDEPLLTKLEEIIKGIKEEYGKQISQKFTSAKTSWEAKSLLNDLIEEADYNMRRILQEHAIWNGEKITSNIARPDLPLLYIAQGDYAHHYNKRASGIYGIPTTNALSPRFRAWVDHARFQPHTFEMIIWDDSDDKPSLRIRTAVEENGNKRILIVRNNAPEGEDDVTLEKFVEAIGNPPSTIIRKLSSFKPAKVQRAAAGTAVGRDFKCYVRDTQPYRSYTHSSVLPADGGMYVVMNNFCPEENLDNISVAKRSNPTNTVWLNLTDFRESGIEDDPNWYSVQEGIKKVKEAYRSEHKNLPEAEGWYLATDGHDVPEVLSQIDKLKDLGNFPKRGPLLQILRLWEKHNDTNTMDHHLVRSELLGIDGTKHRDRILELAKEAEAKHPLIAELVGDWRMLNRATDALKNRLF